MSAARNKTSHSLIPSLFNYSHLHSFYATSIYPTMKYQRKRQVWDTSSSVKFVNSLQNCIKKEAWKLNVLSLFI